MYVPCALNPTDKYDHSHQTTEEFEHKPSVEQVRGTLYNQQQYSVGHMAVQCIVHNAKVFFIFLLWSTARSMENTWTC
jgi:hypothetical protein